MVFSKSQLSGYFYVFFKTAKIYFIAWHRTEVSYTVHRTTLRIQSYNVIDVEDTCIAVRCKDISDKFLRKCWRFNLRNLRVVIIALLINSLFYAVL